MSKLIPLTQGQFAIVDDELYDWLNQYKWCAAKLGGKLYGRFYAIRGYWNGIKQIQVAMHRQILGLKTGDGKQTDHKNCNSLDNRISNLRLCTTSQNQHNQKPHKGRTSQFKSVYWNKRAKKWMAQIRHNSKLIYLGLFNDEIEAAKTYDAKAKELFGEFAKTNF